MYVYIHIHTYTYAYIFIYMLEKLNFVRQMGDRSCANAVDVDIGPPKMRNVSHEMLAKLNNEVI